MTDQRYYARAARGAVLANGYPPLLRNAVLSRPDIADFSAIGTDGEITLGDNGVSFFRSTLFPAIAAAFDGVSTPLIESTSGEQWTVSLVDASGPPTIAVVRENQRVVVPQFALLAPDSAKRLAAFDFIADQHGLASEDAARWRLLLSDRAPGDDELMAIIDDLVHTPVSNQELIRTSLAQNRLSLEVMVPSRESYYRRLVGDFSSASASGADLVGLSATFLTTLLDTGDRRSLDVAWALCSHPALHSGIDQTWRGSDETLAASIAGLVEHGDPISRAGAIELVLGTGRKLPDMAEVIAKLIGTFPDNDPDRTHDDFDLLSALFACVYGQMAKCRILARWPAYARRLAAIAQASLVSRYFPAGDENRPGFIEWVRGVAPNHWVLQVLLDLRTEPRWFPEFNSASQWKDELLGRIVIAENLRSEGGSKDGAVHRNTEASSPIAQGIHMAMFMPGPIEGGAVSPLELSPELVADITEQLQGPVTTSTFADLISAAMVFRLPDQLPDLAAAAIEGQHFQILQSEGLPILACLAGLASVAAICRSVRLANAVFAALRATRFLHPDRLDIDEAFRVGVVACAARQELSQWADHVGQFMTELACLDLTREDATALQSLLATMCHLEPYLWRTCGRAQAALDLVISA